jgi:hypothetical protein
VSTMTKSYGCPLRGAEFDKKNRQNTDKGDKLPDVLFEFFDMDMSYARVVRTASLTSYPVRCKILHQRTASLS